MTNHSLSYGKVIRWVQCYCWFYELLSADQQQTFMTLLDKFVDEVNFVGVGLTVSEEMRIAVGGWAVLLVLNRPLNINWYRRIERVSIYPGSTLKSDETLGALLDGSHYCQIHLAWEDIRDSATKATDTNNTILHEFAHSLDHFDMTVDGHPSLLLSKSETDAWKRVFRAEYIHARPHAERSRLWNFFGLGAWRDFDPDDVSCVDVGELFAVSTEMFFECPAQLRRAAPEIYDCLKTLYRLDPIVQFPKKQHLAMMRDATRTALNRARW